MTKRRRPLAVLGIGLASAMMIGRVMFASHQESSRGEDAAISWQDTKSASTKHRKDPRTVAAGSSRDWRPRSPR